MKSDKIHLFVCICFHLLSNCYKYVTQKRKSLRLLQMFDYKANSWGNHLGIKQKHSHNNKKLSCSCHSADIITAWFLYLYVWTHNKTLGTKSTVLNTFRNAWWCSAKVNMRLQQSEFAKSSGYLPKIQSSGMKPHLCVGAGQGNTVWGNTKREFHTWRLELWKWRTWFSWDMHFCMDQALDFVPHFWSCQEGNPAL